MTSTHIKELAAANGMSCRKLAERFGIPYRTMEDWGAALIPDSRPHRAENISDASDGAIRKAADNADKFIRQNCKKAPTNQLIG